MSELGDDFRAWKKHKREVKQRHDDAVDVRGLEIMWRSILEAGLHVQTYDDGAKPRWRVFDENDENWIDFWPHTGTLYQPKKQIHEWVSDWRTAGKFIRKLLTKNHEKNNI